MVLKYPPLLTYSIAGNLEPKIDFLQHHFQVTEVEVKLVSFGSIWFYLVQFGSLHLGSVLLYSVRFPRQDRSSLSLSFAVGHIASHADAWHPE